MRDTILVAGALAQKPRHGGHTWVFLQYLLGLKRLGWDVLFLDRLEPGMCVDEQGRECELDESANLRYVREVMEGFGIPYALFYDHGARVVGLPRSEIRARALRAAFLLNVMGYLDDEEVLGDVPRRVFLDIDPGFPQMWCALGLHDAFRGHDDFVTVGANLGQGRCVIPTCGLNWLTTRPPVVLDYWEGENASRGGFFTSIASWRGAYGPVEFAGKTYGLRVHEFRRFAALPRLTEARFQLALDIDPADAQDLALLESNRWSFVAPELAASDPWAYQAYIQRSQAEFMVAKNMYVQTRGGWFSDRSACYLASGKPVLAQDTGLGSHYPMGEGLVTFSTLDEARIGAEEIRRDYSRHTRAARRIAEECFNSDYVLRELLGKLGVS